MTIAEATSTPLEIAWTVIMFIGLAFSLWNVFDSYRDVKDVARLVDGVKPLAMETARLSLLSEIVRSTQLIILLITGIIALTSPPTSTSPQRQNTFAVLFIVFGLLLTSNTIIIFRGRRRIIKRVVPELVPKLLGKEDV